MRELPLGTAPTTNTPDVKKHTRRNPVWVLLTVVTTIAALIGGGNALARQSKSEAAQSKSKPETKTEKNTEAKVAAKPENPFPDRRKAPSLDGGSAWLNTKGEITMKDLRGKIVLLDFWTYCCVNCMHVLPDLKYLEKKFPNEIVVIGVHSAKFDTEKDSKSISNAIVRYEIEHPVINDDKMKVWNKFGARAWPTLVMLDPEGYYCGYVSGEGNRELLEMVIKKLIKYHKAKGTLDTTPVKFALEREKLKPGPLKYPGKVLADAKSNRLFTSDSNHNRIVVSTLDGKLLDIIGSGAMGKKDGNYAEASFDHPQGMTLVGETLYVADTENHLIRKIDLKKKTVTTFAGNGTQPRRREATGKLLEVSLNSPWALQHVNGVLYVCMAGPHQIWSHKLGSKDISVFAGSGREDITDGPHLAAALAQPSGITTDGKFLYIADSEGSSIRKISIDPKGKVETIAGASDLPLGRTLFEFGDKDGLGGDARFQHPLGVAFDGKKTLYVADSYNHKIRKIEFTAKGGKVTTFLGDATQGTRLKPPRFSEPEGLSVAGGKLYIADTNNHRICVADLKTGKTTVLKIAGLLPPKPPKDETVIAVGLKNAVEVAPQKIAAGKNLPVEISLKLPSGYKLNKDFPTRYRLTADKNQTLIAAGQLTGRHAATINGETITLNIPLAKMTGKATIELALSFGYCRAGVGGLCKLKTTRWRIPLELSAKATQKSVELKAEVVDKLPKVEEKPKEKSLGGQ